ncbi:MAG TPA: thiamine ABC transporter substrate-binding protein, partial [Chloroflexi bacterium]|nr:thiamine ABC transporter substrate-binding protein [Chloroflexota bacterium]
NGKYPMVVSYASSPPAEVIFSETPITEAPTSSIVASETCFRQIEFIGIIKGTTNRKLSEHWIDFVLTETFQEDIPMQMFMFPVNGSANLPSEFVKHAQLAKKTSIVAPEDIEQNRDQWIKAWSDLMIN